MEKADRRLIFFVDEHLSGKKWILVRLYHCRGKKEICICLVFSHLKAIYIWYLVSHFYLLFNLSFTQLSLFSKGTSLDMETISTFSILHIVILNLFFCFLFPFILHYRETDFIFQNLSNILSYWTIFSFLWTALEIVWAILSGLVLYLQYLKYSYHLSYPISRKHIKYDFIIMLSIWAYEFYLIFRLLVFFILWYNSYIIEMQSSLYCVYMCLLAMTEMKYP